VNRGFSPESLSRGKEVGKVIEKVSTKEYPVSIKQAVKKKKKHTPLTSSLHKITGDKDNNATNNGL